MEKKRGMSNIGVRQQNCGSQAEGVAKKIIDWEVGTWKKSLPSSSDQMKTSRWGRGGRREGAERRPGAAEGKGFGSEKSSATIKKKKKVETGAEGENERGGSCDHVGKKRHKRYYLKKRIRGGKSTKKRQREKRDRGVPGERQRY